MGVKHPCSQVILVNLIVKPLAGKEEWIIYILFGLSRMHQAERLVCIAVFHIAVRVNDLPDAA